MKIESFKLSGPIKIEPIKDRWYRISESVEIEIKHDTGVWRFMVCRGFNFDGRSGGPLADLFVPNLGKQREVACWLIHDILGHGTMMTFDVTNEILRQMLILAGRSRFKAWMVKKAVGLSDSWFGIETKEEKQNIQYVRFTWDDR